MIYNDRSALVKLVLTEPESGQLFRYVNETSEDGHGSSELAIPEICRALRRNNADKKRPADSPQLHQQLILAETLMKRLSLAILDGDILRCAAAFVDPALRTLDAIHLASAQKLGDDVTAFVTYDARLHSAATAVGLNAVSP
ncbi:MAG: type II toxin-antitoxin system VapC family toxin [Mycobacteriales bacterium]